MLCCSTAMNSITVNYPEEKCECNKKGKKRKKKKDYIHFIHAMFIYILNGIHVIHASAVNSITHMIAWCPNFMLILRLKWNGE